MTRDEALIPAAGVHEHAGRLGSVETEDGGVNVSERMCVTCSAVVIEGA